MEELYGRIADLRGILEHVHSIAIKWRVEAEQLEKEKTALENEVRLLNASLEAQRREIRDKDGTIGAMRDDLARTVAARENLARANNEFVAKNERLLQEKDGLVNAYKKLEALVMERSNAIEVMGKIGRLDKLDRELRDREDKLLQLQNSLDIQKKEQVDKGAALKKKEDELNACERECASLKQKYKDKLRGLEESEKKVLARENDCNKRAKEQDARQRELETLQKQLDARENKLDICGQQRGANRHDRGGMVGELNIAPPAQAGENGALKREFAPAEGKPAQGETVFSNSSAPEATRECAPQPDGAPERPDEAEYSAAAAQKILAPKNIFKNADGEGGQAAGYAGEEPASIEGSAPENDDAQANPAPPSGDTGRKYGRPPE